MPAPDLYMRTFTWDELERLATTVRFTHQMLDAAGYPQSTLDELTLLNLRVSGTDLPLEGGIAA